MSPSRRSESASPSSPEPGPAAEKLEVELEASRQRPAGWTVFGIVVGALLVWKLGTVAQWGGVILIVIGLFRAWELVQSFLHPAGTFEVSAREVVLPRGLHLGRPFKVAPAEVTAVYFLRKSVPWNRASPVLVVELGRRAIAYPRDWFASEADQRHIVHALLAGRPTEPTGATPQAVLDDDRTALIVELGGGGALAAIGAVIAAVAAQPVIAFGPIVAGAMLVWRGINRRL